jgi:hypothetical protein
MANTKVTKAVLANDAVGLDQLDISNDPSNGQALTYVATSNDLQWADNTVAGISSSADATAITINSSEQVGIGVSPDTLLHVSTTGSGDKAKIGNGTRHGFIAVDSSGVSLGNEASQGGELLYLNEANGYASIFTGGSERMRITSAGQLAVGNTGFGTGVIAYDRDVGAPYWGMNVTENSTYNDNNGHGFSSKHNTHGVIYIKDEGNNTGYAALPFYPNGGGGIAYEWNILDPDNGTWVRGNVGFGLGGSSNLDFTVAFATGSGTITVTRTAGTALYRVVIMEFAQQ